MANMRLKSAHCAVSGNVLYVHSPILRILWHTFLRLTIPIKCDVLHSLCDGIGDGIPSNRWYIVKICMCHWWVSITGNTWRFDTSSFDPYSVHIGLPPDSRGNSYNSWNICCGWINHLQCRFTQCGLYQMPQTQYWNSDLRSWIYIKCWSWWHTVCYITVPQKASNILPFIVGYITPE